MNFSVANLLITAMVISQVLLLRAIIFPSEKAGGSVLTLSPEVKAYIDSHASGAGASGGEMVALLKKVSDLEQQAARFEYLRSTLTALEESQMRLGKMALDAPATISDLVGPAREREVVKFSSSVMEFCAGGGAIGKPMPGTNIRGKPVFVESPSSKAKAGK